MHSLVPFDLASVLIVLCGCGGTTALVSADGGQDAESGAADGACNTVPNLSLSRIPVSDPDGGPPEPVGGIIQDGTYAVTEEHAYPVPSGGLPPGSYFIGGSTLRFRGNLVESADYSVAPPLRTNATFTIAGTTISYQLVCGPSNRPDGGIGSSGRVERFTATSSTYTVFVEQPDGLMVITYTKQ